MIFLRRKNAIQKAQSIRIKEGPLSHSSTRTIKMDDIKEVFESVLPPTPIPIRDMVDYDLIRVSYMKMLEAEGFKELWQPGQEPPPEVQEWWGKEDFDLFKMCINQNISKQAMDIIRDRYKDYKRNAINFFKDKMLKCYAHRLGGEDRLAYYHMRLKKEVLDQLKQEKVQREGNQERARVERENRERRERSEREVEERVEREVRERIELEVQERVERQVRERERLGREARLEEGRGGISSSHGRSRSREPLGREPPRRNTTPLSSSQEDEGDEDVREEGDKEMEEGGRLKTCKELQALGDPNSSVLERDSSTIGVVRAKSVRPLVTQRLNTSSSVTSRSSGPSTAPSSPAAHSSPSTAGPSGASQMSGQVTLQRPDRTLLKCPFAGCYVSRRSQDALNMHIDNNH